MNSKISPLRRILFLFFLLLCLAPFMSPPLALLLGIVVAQFIGHPYIHINHKLTHILLQVSVVGLGFGMNINTAIAAGKEGFIFTVISIVVTLGVGYCVGKFLKINHKTAYLIAIGTAICGGSAIAAVSPVVKADEKQISVALGTIFILNSVALFIFPTLGHAFHLSSAQFGIWSAIAIQDTSSVVGAASRYGAEALQIATTVKLTRALWIIPVAFVSSYIFKAQDAKIKIPYFIGLFVIAILLNTYVSYVDRLNSYILAISKIGLTVTLYLIGSGLSKDVLREVGLKPIIQGGVLWLILSFLGLWMVVHM